MLEGYDDLLCTEEAAEALKIGKNALYALLADGSLKAYRNDNTGQSIPEPEQPSLLWYGREYPLCLGA